VAPSGWRRKLLGPGNGKQGVSKKQDLVNLPQCSRQEDWGLIGPRLGFVFVAGGTGGGINWGDIVENVQLELRWWTKREGGIVNKHAKGQLHRTTEAGGRADLLEVPIIFS